MTIPEAIMIVLAVGQLAYAGLTYHRDRRAAMEPDPKKQPHRPIFIIAGFMVLTWAAVAFDYYDRHYMQPPSEDSFIISFGEIPGPNPVFDVQVDSEPLKQYSGKYRLMLIVRKIFIDRDRMTDTHISKSGLYTIDGSKFTLGASPMADGPMLTYGTNNIEHDLVLVPIGVEPAKITKLEDVTVVGGKIIFSRASTLTALQPLAQPPQQIFTNPTPTPPPSPKH